MKKRKGRGRRAHTGILKGAVLQQSLGTVVFPACAGGLIFISLLRQENWKATGEAFWMNRKEQVSKSGRGSGLSYEHNEQSEAES